MGQSEYLISFAALRNSFSEVKYTVTVSWAGREREDSVANLSLLVLYFSSRFCWNSRNQALSQAFTVSSFWFLVQVTENWTQEKTWDRRISTNFIGKDFRRLKFVMEPLLLSMYHSEAPGARLQQPVLYHSLVLFPNSYQAYIIGSWLAQCVTVSH